jgi:hypothetical protein
MQRRDFLIGSAALATVVDRSRAQTSNKLDRVAVMTSYFGTRMPDTRDKGHPVVTKDLNLLDFPDMIADHFQIHNVELQQVYFPSTEPAYFRELLGRLKKAKSRVSNMPLEFDEQGTPGIISVCSADPEIRRNTIELTKQWIDHAATLGSPSVMVNQGDIAPDGVATAVEGLKIVSAYGKRKNVAVTMENRGKTTPETLVKVIQDSGTFANPDIGNFPDEETRARGLRLLYPLSHGNTHVKMNPERMDFDKAIAISKEMGYKGLYSIEANRIVAPEPLEAVRIVLDELLKNI